MEKTPNIVYMDKKWFEIVNSSNTMIDGEWVPARPYGFYSLLYRLKATWLVLAGKADALVWPKGQ